MKLIGIYINEKTPTEIHKNLNFGWYPFLQGYEYKLGQVISPQNNRNLLIDTLYKTSETSPEIFIHAIVGKNGSGKSSILEILFRLINNFAFQTTGNEKRQASEQLTAACGLSATLYYEIEGEIHSLMCEWDKNDDTKGIIKIDGEPINEDNIHENRTLENHRKFIENFFYTITVNYSHYSLNTLEVVNLPNDGKDRSHWLDGLFHKNDGYLTPIVISPRRSHGNININTENALGKERLIGLLILYWLKNMDFLEEYKVIGISASIEQLPLKSKFFKKAKEYKTLNNRLYYDVLFCLYYRWYSWIETEKKEKLNCLIAEESYLKYLVKGERNNESVINAVFEYLASPNIAIDDNTINICLLYMAHKTISISQKYSGFECNFNDNSSIDELMQTILQDKSHISLKIKQCIYHLINRLLDTNPLVNVKISTFCRENNLSEEKGQDYSVDDIFEILPPPVFQTDLALQPIDLVTKKSTKEKLVQLSEMSSGERQMLYSLSSVMYHLRNIQSVRVDNRVDKKKVQYQHVNVILDEVEMYYHPEYQRRYLNKLLSLINGLKLDKDRIKSINICIVTHSPFILSDILRENILFLEKGKVISDKVKEETFGANIYDILRNGFFLDKNALGYFVNDRIEEVMQRIKIEEGAIKKRTVKQNLKKGKSSTKLISLDETKTIVNIIGDPFIRGYLLSKLEDDVQN
ncbi:hypothetical protein EZS27_014408 [termite gut metagenome]|uniref:Endonuclease GajA/Old nuclease/RecF-like AAA domain-containing protein n=1 Tax=termite gut metagenome TaxID=433724 RepID=A0A5J4RWT9_9ZZZZ